MRAKMRLLGIPLALTILLVLARAAGADVAIGSGSASGEIELGVRGVSDDFGSAKYEQYRDEGPGLVNSGHFLLEDAAGRRYLWARFANATSPNQEYELRLGRYGAYNLEFGLSQLPQMFSNQAVTPYLEGSDARLVLPAGFVRTDDPAALAGQLTAFDHAAELDFRQRDGHAKLSLYLGEDVTLNAGYQLQQKKGTRPFRLAYGNPGPFGSFVEVAVPIDEVTREVTASLELLRDAWNLALAYRGSFFRNDLDSVTVDNPFATGPAQARAALAPDNSSNSLRLSGAATLGLDFPARLAGTLSLALYRQDEDFLPHTINPALAADPSLVLPEDDLDGEVLTYTANVVFSARPRPALNLKLRYRAHGYDNRTDVFTLAGHVESDNSLSTEPLIAARNEYMRQTASLDLSYRVGTNVLDVTYAWKNTERNSVRAVTHLNEHITSAAIRARPTSWVELRVGISTSRRNGNNYKFGAYAAETREPADVAGAVLTTVFPELRKFPQSDRVRHRLDLLATLHPTEALSLTLTGEYGRSDFDNSDFGLTDEDTWNVAVETDYRVNERIGVSAHYSYDDARRNQRSRIRPRNFVPPIVVVDDPANDWKSRSRDGAHNFGLALGLSLVPNRLDADLSWEYQSAKASTRASGPGGAAVDYQSIKDNLQILSATLNYELGESVTLRAGYRFERFNGSNFQRDDVPAFSTFAGTANGLFLRNEVDDYEAHFLAMSIRYRF